ncbi:MAG: DUF1579 family protein [Gemmatimonadaceae bacterium]
MSGKEPRRIAERFESPVRLIFDSTGQNHAFGRYVIWPGPSYSCSVVQLTPGPVPARLTAMTGTWDVETTFWFRPGIPPVVSKGVSTIRSLFDGLYIEEKIEGALNGAPFTTLAWTGFNTSSRQYEATRIASTSSVRIAETGAWDDRARRFELTGSSVLGADTWTQRMVIEPTTSDSMIATTYRTAVAVRGDAGAARIDPSMVVRDGSKASADWRGVEVAYILLCINVLQALRTCRKSIRPSALQRRTSTSPKWR